MVTQKYDYDLICIGSGPAGQRAAVQAAKLGRRAAVIERQAVGGGVCVETGTIPSKTFREAVTTTMAALDIACRILPNGSAPPRPTAAQLLARVGDVVRRETDVMEHQLRRNGVDVITGRAAFDDPHTLIVQSPEAGVTRRVSAESILVAVGTVPSAPPGAAVDGETVLTSDEIGTLARVPRSMTVVGAGVIGIEYASMFAALGVDVTLIDKRDRPLEFLDREIVDELMHQMRKRNVSFRCGEAVDNVEILAGPPRRAALTLQSGKRVVSDMVLFSVGRNGATADLALDRAGLAADDRGRLTVDAQFRTAVPHIFAAGDVIGYPSLAATSSEQGRLAACHALGIPAKPMADHFPIGIYAIPEIGMVGLPEHELTKQKVPYEVGIARYHEIARGQILGDESGYFKMLFHRDDRRLLGVHIMGTQATELLHIGQAVLGLGAGLDYFLETVFNYPTLAECYKVAALNAANKMSA
jgi:NAD(P) transhydrogenase